MFFVGATGQLLTLILTVCLPCIFLFSAQPKTELLGETLLIEYHDSHQLITQVENSTFQIHFDFVENLQNIHTEFEDSSIQKIPHKKVRVKWKSFYAKSCGNKAPPAFHCFSC